MPRRTIPPYFQAFHKSSRGVSEGADDEAPLALKLVVGIWHLQGEGGRED